MNRGPIRSVAVTVIVVALVVVAPSPADAVGMAFVPNRGQAPPHLDWLAHAPGATVGLAGDRLLLALPDVDRTVELAFEGADPDAPAVGVDPLPGRVNYLRGDDPAAWRTDLSSYAAVAVRALYDGVDLRLEGDARTLKGTFEVAPGTDPRAIRGRYRGVDDVRPGERGDLVLGLNGRTMTESPPVAWQLDGDRRTPVDVAYRLDDDGSVGFEIGPYDPARNLVIDPYLEFAALVGGSEGDEGRAIVVDAQGNGYVTGTTRSPDFPAAGAPQPGYAGPTDPSNLGDAFILKLAPDGQTVLFMTYLGGSGEDVGDAIALDPAGGIVVAGGTESTDFPTANPLQPVHGGQGCSSSPCADLFVARLSPAGDALGFSTYLGGSRDESVPLVDFGTRQNAVGLDVGADGAIYVLGTSDSPDFPVMGGFQTARAGLADLVLVKLSGNGSRMLYGTYLGGSGAEYAGDVAVDGAGRAWIVGGTLSSSFPTRNALDDDYGSPSDAVVARIDTTRTGDGSLLASTYLGGHGRDQAFAVGLLPNGRVAVTGWTGSEDFPTAGAFQPTNGSAGMPSPRDAFLAVLSGDGGTLLYGSYLGGSGRDVAYDLAVAPGGVVALVGPTTSDDLPVRLPYQARRGGGNDLLIARFDPARAGDASLVDATYLGGDDSDNGYAVAVGPGADLFVTGVTGGVVSDTFPVDATVGPNATADGVLIARLDPRVQSWILVGSRADGANDSIWRTDLGVFNASDEIAEVSIRFHGAGGVLDDTLVVAPGDQLILDDVVGLLGGSGSGAIEVLADRDVKVTSRTYNLVASGQACFPGGTLGQGFTTVSTRAVLGVDDRAWLPQLAENDAYRTNIALTNTGLAPARVQVRLYDGDGRLLDSSTVELAPGQWRQQNRPFFQRAGRDDITAGYAEVIVEEGGGVVAVGSVVDNITNDPTTVPMIPADGAGSTVTWVLVGSRVEGANDSIWRTDLAILNVSLADARVTVRVHTPGGGVLSTTVDVPRGEQLVLADVLGTIGFNGSGAIELLSDAPVVATSRIYNRVAAGQPCFAGGTLGQENAGYGPGSGLSAGEAAWLNQLTENDAYRTNIALTNTGDTAATVLVELFDGNGASVGSYRENLAPAQWRQQNRPFARIGGSSDLAAGYARVTVESGSGVLAVASVVDNVTNDPTTIVWLR